MACSVTKPNGDTPPGQSPSADYYGNGALWTVLYSEGVVFRPGGLDSCYRTVRYR